MKIERINSDEYSKIFNKHYIIYNSVKFNLFNVSKCERIEFLLLHADNKKIGLIAGIKEGKLLSPFSAPFASFSVQNPCIRIEFIKEGISILEEYAKQQNLSAISLILPPSFYNEQLISKLIICLKLNNYTDFIAVNHYFKSIDITKYDQGKIEKDLRYKLNSAAKAGLIIRKGESIEDFRMAYEIIYLNKSSRNRVLSMNFDQLLDMFKSFDVDSFVVYRGNDPVASAIIYIHSPGIAQIIYWGNIPETYGFYPMNFLSANIFRFYCSRNFEIIDLGTSMLGNELNEGLINFKESIGATTSFKFSFSKDIITN